MRWSQFCQIVNQEILYLDDECRVEETEYGELTLGELRFPKSITMYVTVPLRAESEATSQQDMELETFAYEFDHLSFEGELLDLNTIMVKDQDGEYHEFTVYHEVPVDLRAAYDVT